MDQITQLRQLIRESIQEYIREVETSGNVAAQEAKIRACEEAIALREKKINMEGLDEAYHDMIDETKKKGLEKEIKELQKYKAKTEKLLEKMKAKAAPKKMEDESVEETAVVDEVTLDENDPEAGPQLEGDALDEAKKKKMTAAQKDKKEDIVKGMKKSGGFGKSKEEKGKMYATATKLATKESVNPINENITMNKQFLHMQKLAGLITESEYKQKLNENYNLQPIKSILSSNLSPEEKMDKIGDFMTDTEEGSDLSNTNLGNPVDGWFSSKKNATKWLNQIQSLVSNPEKIKDISDDLI